MKYKILNQTDVRVELFVLYEDNMIRGETVTIEEIQRLF